MPSSLNNFVRSVLQADCGPTDDTLMIQKAAAPLQDPPGATEDAPGVLALIDQPSTPTKVEIVAYTGQSVAGDIVTLTGVSRGQEGTTAQSWTAGTPTYQPITAGVIQALQTDVAGKLASDGTAVAADKWAAAITLTLAGKATGSVQIDGSGNVTLNVTDINADFLSTWDAQGSRLLNLGSAQLDSDGAQWGQVQLAIEQALSGSGNPTTVAVAPKLYSWDANGTDTDFPLDDSDVTDALFYDVAVGDAGELREPYTDYTVVGDPGDLALRFAAAPAAGRVWAVLRGYARPYAGAQPLTTVAFRVVSLTGAATIDGSYQNTLILVTASEDVTLTIPANAGTVDDWKAGEFFSVMQVGSGKVTIAVADGGSLVPLPGFSVQTRDQDSIISASCLYADANQWAITGDLLRTVASPSVEAFTLPCSDETATDIAVAANVYQFRMPYALLLTEARATLNVAQTTGDLVSVDVKVNGTSIFSTQPSIDNGELTSTTADTPPVLANPDSTVLADGDLLSVDVTQVGTAGARGLKVQLIGQRAS